MNNLISVLLYSLMVKELCIHCIYMQSFQHLLLLLANQAGVQFHRCIYTCNIYEYVLDIHKYLQTWSHRQMDILNVKWTEEEMLMNKVIWRMWNFWSTRSQYWPGKQKQNLKMQNSDFLLSLLFLQQGYYNCILNSYRSVKILVSTPIDWFY